MNEKERLLTTLAGRPVDRPPLVCPGGMMSMVVTEFMDTAGACWPAAHSDPAQMALLTMAAHEQGGIENLGVPFCMTIEAEGMGAAVELGGRENEPRVIRYAVDRLDRADGITPLDVSAGRARVCLDAIRILKEKAPHLPVIANLSGPVSLAASLVDPLLFYRALRRDKEAAHRLIRFYSQSLRAFGDAMLEAGADAVCLADPSATGEIIGRAAFEEFVLPHVNGLTSHFRERFGVPSMVHICGNVKSLGPALAVLDAEAVSVDSLVGIATLRELAPDKVTMGNVSTFLLEKGTPEEIIRASRRCLADGVDILAPACGIGPRTAAANIRGMFEAVVGWA